MPLHVWKVRLSVSGKLGADGTEREIWEPFPKQDGGGQCSSGPCIISYPLPAAIHLPCPRSVPHWKGETALRGGLLPQPASCWAVRAQAAHRAAAGWMAGRHGQMELVLPLSVFGRWVGEF